MGKTIAKKHAAKVLDNLMARLADEAQGTDTNIRDALKETLVKLATHKMPAVSEAVRLELEQMLDDLSDNDVWGTEGQLDPRGDQREAADDS